MEPVADASTSPPPPRRGAGLKHVGRHAVARLGGALNALLGSRAGGAFGILTYHRVTPRPDGAPAPTWNVTPRRFREQLGGLLARGYVAYPLRRALAGPLPRGAFVVTFDDGYENVHRHAWPVLRDLGVPATVFLATAYLDAPSTFPSDDWPAAGSPDVPAESWRPLTTAQCLELRDGGLIDLGSHTHTHAVFTGRPALLAEDVRRSAEVLRERFGLSDATFSFPFGIFGPDLIAAARRPGLLCGLTTRAALVEPGSDPFTWGRFNVEEEDTPATLAAKLDGWYEWLLAPVRRLSGRRAPFAGPVTAGATP
ncbi:MAG TPA: polysaccharide deacetylase family protein [Gemmataceae bacterium]|nr:polysaccharide deacetylase family protein [Gemmataceae bacterium]